MCVCVCVCVCVFKMFVFLCFYQKHNLFKEFNNHLFSLDIEQELFVRNNIRCVITSVNSFILKSSFVFVYIAFSPYKLTDDSKN